MSNPLYKCPYCNAKPFKSKRGLIQHQRSSVKCSDRIIAQFGDKTSGHIAHDVMQVAAAIPTQGRQNTSVNFPNTNNQAPETEPNFEMEQTDTNNLAFDEEMLDGFVNYDDNSDDSSVNLASTASTASEDCLDESIRDNFHQCVDWAQKNLLNHPKNHQIAINLLHRLRQTKASLNTCELVMEWHLCATGGLLESQSLADSLDYVARDKLHATLKNVIIYPMTTTTSSARLRFHIHEHV